MLESNQIRCVLKQFTYEYSHPPMKPGLHNTNAIINCTYTRLSNYIKLYKFIFKKVNKVQNDALAMVTRCHRTNPICQTKVEIETNNFYE